MWQAMMGLAFYILKANIDRFSSIYVYEKIKNYTRNLSSQKVLEIFVLKLDST